MKRSINRRNTHIHGPCSPKQKNANERKRGKRRIILYVHNERANVIQTEFYTQKYAVLDEQPNNRKNTSAWKI